MLAPCGLLCENCDAYIATQANDENAIKEVAKKWSEMNQTPIEPAHIYCDGCNTEGRKSYYCTNLCEIKKCVTAKELSDCGKCSEFDCDKLQPIFKHEPEAKNRLQNC